MESSQQVFDTMLQRLRQSGEGARLAGGGSGERRGIWWWSGCVLRGAAAVWLGEDALRGTIQTADFWW